MGTASQSNTTWLGVLDAASRNFAQMSKVDIFKGSSLLGLIASKSVKVMDGAMKFTKTFTGRTKRLYVDKYESFNTVAELNDVAIRYGDTVEGNYGKNMLTMDIDAFDLGFGVSCTQEDRQRITQQSGDFKNNVVDFIENSYNQKRFQQTAYIFKELIQGSGTVTKTTGVTRASTYGLDTIIGTGTLYGKTTADWKYWYGHVFNMNSTTLLGYTASSAFASISQLISIPTGRRLPVFIDVLRKIASQLPKMDGDEIYCVMHPYVYEYVFLPCVESIKSGAAILNGSNYATSVTGSNDKSTDLSLIKRDGYRFSEEKLTVMKDDIRFNNQYMFPLASIYFINPRYAHLEAETTRNMVDFPWTEDYTKHSTYIKRTEGTLCFYTDNRFGLAKATIHATTVLELQAITGNVIGTMSLS